MLKEEFLEPLGITQSELANAMGVDPKFVTELCDGQRPVMVDTAHRLSQTLGTTPQFWLNLQRVNDLWQDQRY